MMVYIGKKEGAFENDVRASDRVVLSLIDKCLDEEKTLVKERKNNYYTNAAIATKLLHKNSTDWNAKKNSIKIPKKGSEA